MGSNRNHRSTSLWPAALAVVATLAATACSDAEAPPRPADPAAPFRPCAVCHVAAPPDSPGAQLKLIGPNLFGVYGAPAGRRQAFAYSRALSEAEFTWDDAALDAFLTRPTAFLPGTRMAYEGEPDPQKRAAIIAYLKSRS